MVNVGAFDAKTHLPALLGRVAKGETIQITRRGIPVARIVPIESTGKRDPRKAAVDIRKLRKGLSLSGLTVRQLIDEGRRH